MAIKLSLRKEKKAGTHGDYPEENNLGTTEARGRKKISVCPDM